MRGTLSATLRAILYLAIPASVGLLALRYPIVQLLFQRGAFKESSTEVVVWALQFYALGLFAHAVVEIVTRAFYALHDTLTPVLIGVAAMSVNVVLSLILIGPLTHGGLALANSTATILEMVGLLLIMGLVSVFVKPIQVLTDGVRAIGDGTFDTKLDVEGPAEIGAIASVFNEITNKFKKAQESVLEQEKMQKEMEVAKEIQHSLLPRRKPEVSGYDIAPLYQAAAEITVAAQELEAAEEVRRCVPTEPDGDMIGMDPEIELRAGLVAVFLPGQCQPGAERLIARRPIEPRKVWVQRLRGVWRQLLQQILAQRRQCGVDCFYDRPSAALALLDGEGIEPRHGKSLEFRRLIEEHGSPLALTPRLMLRSSNPYRRRARRLHGLNFTTFSGSHSWKTSLSHSRMKHALPLCTDGRR